MAKLNIRNTFSKIVGKKLAAHPDATINYEGGLAFNMDPKTSLYTRVASCLVGEPKFYKDINIVKEDENYRVNFEENQDKQLLEDIKLVAKEDSEFVLKLAAYARNKLFLRTVSSVLLVEASLIDSCKPFVRRYTPTIIKRADEFSETVAYLQMKIGDIGNKAKKGSMPAGLKKGLADAFHNFDEYQFAKYNRKGFVKLKDVLKLVHPKPKNKEQSALFKRIKEDNLKTPETWEVEISTKGSTKKNWKKTAPKMPYMATLRNLRNFLEKEVDMKPILEKISDPELIKNNKQLPFRYFSAYREIEGNPSPYTSKTLDALETALDVSIENLPKLNGKTFIIADNSGSMEVPLSRKTKVKYSDVANIMLSIAHKLCEFPITGIFGDTFKVKNFSQRNGIINNMKTIVSGEVGLSTNAWKAVEYINSKKIKVDRIIIFSDMQCYNSTNFSQLFTPMQHHNSKNDSQESVASEMKKYRQFINPKAFVYCIDLSGCGTTQIPQDEPRTCIIAGWSERILEFISLFEGEKKTAVDSIENIKPEGFKNKNFFDKKPEKKKDAKKTNLRKDKEKPKVKKN